MIILRLGYIDKKMDVYLFTFLCLKIGFVAFGEKPRIINYLAFSEGK